VNFIVVAFNCGDDQEVESWGDDAGDVTNCGDDQDCGRWNQTSNCGDADDTSYGRGIQANKCADERLVESCGDGYGYGYGLLKCDQSQYMIIIHKLVN
jgi:hypothetical protein